MPCNLVGQGPLIGLVPKPFGIVLVPDARNIKVADRHGQYRFELQLGQLLSNTVAGSQFKWPLFQDMSVDDCERKCMVVVRNSRKAFLRTYRGSPSFANHRSGTNSLGRGQNCSVRCSAILQANNIIPLVG